MTKAMALAVALAMGLVGVSDDAGACGNGVERRVNESVQAIAGAERMVEGDAAQVATAARMVLSAFPAIDKQTPGRSSFSDRAMKVMARAVVRSRGSIEGTRAFAAKTDEQRQAHIDWAVRVLRAFSLSKPKDAGAATDLGEALAQGDLVQRKEALLILASLEARDVIAGARGYAALAGLRRHIAEDEPAFVRHPLRALHDARARIADSRCGRMTKDPALCGGEAVADAS